MRTTRLLLLLSIAPLAFGMGCHKGEDAASAPPARVRQPAPPTGSPTPEAPATALTPEPATTPGPASRRATPAPVTTSTTATTLPPATPPPAPAESKTTPTRPASQPPANEPRTTTAPLPKRAQPKAVTFSARLGAVTFDHREHAAQAGVECSTCHHPSRPQRPLQAEQQACRDCHTSPAAAGMKTGLPRAFHDPKAAIGVCIDCHREATARGEPAPVKCMDCHRKK